MPSQTPPTEPTSRPRLSPRVRRQVDRVTGQPILLFPEGVLKLNSAGNAIVDRLDGRTVDEIIADLEAQFPAADIRTDVITFLKRLHYRSLLATSSSSAMPAVQTPTGAMPTALGRHVALANNTHPPTYRPMGLLAELTYTCPLHCPYCSNPTQYPAGRSELSTDQWRGVIKEAVDMGVLHVLFSGGEPLGRKDLAELVACAREAGAYTNLITSAVGLTEARATSLAAAGLDSVQISFQAHEATLADDIAGTKAHELKRTAAAVVKAARLPLTINVVIHRRNVDSIAEIIGLAEEMGAERLELANVQFYGWAFQNQMALLPTHEQLTRAERISAEARERLRGRMEVHYILPDYFGDRPKPCMNGWGRRYLTVNPVGDVLPCPTASSIPNLNAENIRDRSLTEIWTNSQAFNRFRGTEWMPEPCQSCDLRDVDFGGCRCQSALLTGDAAATDPACSLSPFRDRLTSIVDAAQTPSSMPGYVYRANPAN